MVYIVVAYRDMAYIYSYGLHSYGVYRCSMCIVVAFICMAYIDMPV